MQIRDGRRTASTREGTGAEQITIVRKTSQQKGEEQGQRWCRSRMMVVQINTKPPIGNKTGREGREAAGIDSPSNSACWFYTQKLRVFPFLLRLMKFLPNLESEVCYYNRTKLIELGIRGHVIMLTNRNRAINSRITNYIHYSLIQLIALPNFAHSSNINQLRNRNRVTRRK